MKSSPFLMELLRSLRRLSVSVSESGEGREINKILNKSIINTIINKNNIIINIIINKINTIIY